MGNFQDGFYMATSGVGSEPTPSEPTLFTTTSPIDNPLGDFKLNDVVLSEDNMTINDAINKLLHKYTVPVVSVSLSPSTVLYEKGVDSISTITITANVLKKSNDITYIRFSANNVQIHEITTDVSAGGTFNYEFVPVSPINNNTIFKVDVSDGTNSVNASKNITFVYRQYYGFVDSDVTADEAIIKTLQNNRLANSKSLSYENITFENKKIIFAYPQSYGDLSSILDNNGFQNLSAYTKSSINMDSVEYNVYTMTDATTVTNLKQIFS